MAQSVAEVEAQVRQALANLSRIEAESEVNSAPPNARPSVLDRLQSGLTGWETILSNMAERARLVQEELSSLDVDLNRSLDTFVTARKHLQGS